MHTIESYKDFLRKDISLGLEKSLRKRMIENHDTAGRKLELFHYSFFEKSFKTRLGSTLQRYAVEYGNGVTNLDNADGTKTRGVDLYVESLNFYVQLKSSYNSQCGSHTPHSKNMLIESSNQNNKIPVFAIAFGESKDFVKDEIRYLQGEIFWSLLGINYNMLEQAVKQLHVEFDNLFESILNEYY